MSILLGILTFILILVSLFLILVVLMQKSKDGGMGAALGAHSRLRVQLGPGVLQGNTGSPMELIDGSPTLDEA